MYLMTEYKNFSGLKTKKIKMSSSMTFTFNAVELCVALCSLPLIGLLQGSGCCIMTIMMVIIGMMKVNFEKLKKHQ